MYNIIFCEGKNDTYFLHEILIYKCGVNDNDVNIYKNQRKLNNDIRGSRNTPNLILALDGYPNCCKIPIIFSRSFWSDKTPIKIGVINDENSGIVYEELKNNFRSYVNNPLRVNKIKPNIEHDEDKKEIKLIFHSRDEIVIWNEIIPESLEIQMADVLLKNHPELKMYHDRNDIFNEAKKILGVNQEDLVRHCTHLFNGAGWFEAFCKIVV